jgi:hypothetical protein
MACSFCAARCLAAFVAQARFRSALPRACRHLAALPFMLPRCPSFIFSDAPLLHPLVHCSIQFKVYFLKNSAIEMRRRRTMRNDFNRSGEEKRKKE